jgi:glycylpeptide N-tetradecanoyltransferase
MLQLDRSEPKQSYRFWETQPVDQFDSGAREGRSSSQNNADASSIVEDGPIHELRTPADVRQEPYPLIDQFEWCVCDLQDPDELTEVFDLLRLNYVEDDDAMFRFCYSREFLKWALCPPGYQKDWHLGVRVKATAKLVRWFSLSPSTRACVKN